MPHTVSFGLTLAGLWLLLSGFYDNAPLLSLGAVSVVLVVVVSRRMRVIDHEGHPIHLSFKGIGYWPWLIVEIIKANIDVARIIVAPKMKTGLCVFECDASQKSDIGQVAYANSITLTPGTVTIGMENGRLTVHALTFEGREGILAGEMDRRVSNMENIFADDNHDLREGGDV